MIGQALLAANYVAAAEKAGMKPAEINAALKDIAANSPIEEFWITDSNGRAYPHQHRHRFQLQSRSRQAAAGFGIWRLIAGTATVVVQPAQKREIDNRVFGHVGVAGVDKPRIVQVGVSADNLALSLDQASSSRIAGIRESSRGLIVQRMSAPARPSP